MFVYTWQRHVFGLGEICCFLVWDCSCGFWFLGFVALCFFVFGLMLLLFCWSVVAFVVSWRCAAAVVHTSLSSRPDPTWNEKTRAGILAQIAANTSKILQRPNAANTIQTRDSTFTTLQALCKQKRSIIVRKECQVTRKQHYTAKQGEREANNRTYAVFSFGREVTLPPSALPNTETKATFELM